jgi:alpha-amylase/alpha-mannosidase (GH57 family)
MHQPYYEDLVTGEHILPWVRLHALKDYYGMVALLREFPQVRMTFNLVPSLLVQLEAFAADRARDEYLDLGMKPAADLTEAEAIFLIQNFFHAQRARMIEIYPRYAELLARRGALSRPSDAHAALARFTTDDLRDLQVWQKLAWIDPFYQDQDARTRSLIAKGRRFTEDDKRLLRQVELELLNAVIPAYRELAARGQIEVSASPFYHPILPLLCDTDVYKRTHPDARGPRHRFAHPEDALHQLHRATACHERLFGIRPVGLWPSEGSVSDEMVPLCAQAGFTWMATDELILARTFGTSLTRDAQGRLDQPERLYRAYAVGVGGARMACVFRDHTLSDLIGFTYSGWAAEAAADDFVSRLVEAGRAFASRTGGEEAIIPIILDGENAWEHFEGGGRPFLRALYRRLSSHPELTTVTVGEACRKPTAELSTIFPGSWIDANFYIWIGHADDQRAWSQLGDARDAVEGSPEVDEAARARAREEVLIAEGSDWFWWYGDDHSSDHDMEFDDLFRRHLRNVYRLLNKPTPDELFVSNITTGAAPRVETEPTALLAPTLDGEDTSYFEWLNAGTLQTYEAAGGSMHRAEQRPLIVTFIRFGFDRNRFYLRLDAGRRVRDLLDEGYRFTLKFLRPEGVEIVVQQTASGAGVAWNNNGSRPSGEASVAAGTVLELAVPLAALGPLTARALSFVVIVSDGVGQEVERHPAYQPIEATIPDARFEARHWTV